MTSLFGIFSVQIHRGQKIPKRLLDLRVNLISGQFFVLLLVFPFIFLLLFFIFSLFVLFLELFFDHLVEGWHFVFFDIDILILLLGLLLFLLKNLIIRSISHMLKVFRELDKWELLIVILIFCKIWEAVSWSTSVNGYSLPVYHSKLFDLVE